VYAPAETPLVATATVGAVAVPPIVIDPSPAVTLVTGAVPDEAAVMRPSEPTVREVLVYEPPVTPEADTATVGLVAVPPTVIEPSPAVTDITPVSIASTYCNGTNWAGSVGVGTVPAIRGRAPNVE
jgi:hypothetical protein